MSIEGLLLAVVLTGLSLIWVVAPLVRGVSQRSHADDTLHKRRERLLMYYERIVTNVRDLDEDSATGKIATETYTAEREDWMQRGIQVLKALDALDASEPTALSPVDHASADRDLDAAIEAAIAARRERGGPQSTSA